MNSVQKERVQVKWDLLSATGLAVVAAVLLWNSPFLLPIKVFVVYFHEVSHALATWVTGGEVIRMGVSADEGGITESRGGSRLLILSAGYIGSAIWGYFFLMVAFSRVMLRRSSLFALGFLFFASILLFTKDLFTLIFLFSAATLSLVLAWKGSDWLQILFFWGIGIFSSLYAVFDIFSDILSSGPFAGITILGGEQRFTDAEMLARITYVPAFFWGVAWSVIAIVTMGIAVWKVSTKTVNQQVQNG